MQEKLKLLELYQLTLEKDKNYWQKKENMSPWKVFSEHLFKERDLLWLLFRVHKLCGAKYNYFSKNIGEFRTIKFLPDRTQGCELAEVEAFQHLETGRLVTISKLQMIRDKNVFIDWIEIVSGKRFSEF